MTSGDSLHTRTILVVHPGAELFGSDRMTLESVRGLTQQDQRVIVALPIAGPLVSALEEAGAEVVITPMLVLRKALLRPSSWASLLAGTLKGAVAGWRLISHTRPSAIYVSTVTLPQWPILARLRRIASIVHIHEAEASAARAVSVALYAPLLAADSLIVNSAFSRDVMSRAIPRLGRRASVVHNGVAGPSVPPTPVSVRPDMLRVLYLGRLSERKGVDDVLSAVLDLHADGERVSLTILGSAFTGYEWYEARLRERAEGAGRDCVVFRAFEPDVWSIIGEHDVVVVPSRTDESFGNTAVEAVLAGRPVIVTDLPGLREAVGCYTTARVVDPSSPEQISSTLSAMRQDWSSIRAELTENARRAAQRHDPVSYGRAVRDIVGSCADRRA